MFTGLTGNRPLLHPRRADEDVRAAPRGSGRPFEEKEGAVFSDGAYKAIAAAKSVLFQPDWKKVFEPEALAESVRQITKTE